MDTDDTELVARLKRLDASGSAGAPAFDYDGMLERHAAAGAGARRRLVLARGAAGVLLVALVGVSLWRINLGEPGQQVVQTQEDPAVETVSMEPRIVRADTYLALAALEERIASVDDALSVARVYSPRGAEVARLERTRAELFDSYSRVRYAELVANNY
jgi:hypothetical protein